MLGRRGSRCCCAGATPCFCTGTAFTEFQVTLSGFADGGVSGLASLINGTYLIPIQETSPSACAGESLDTQTVLRPHINFPGSCTKTCNDTDGSRSDNIKVKAFIKPIGTLGPGGLFALIGLKLRVELSIIGFAKICTDVNWQNYSEYWYWESDIGVVNCLDIDEDLSLVTTLQLPDYLTHCSVGNLDDASAVCNLQLIA